MQQVLWVDPVAQDRADGDAFGRGKAIPIPEGWVGRAADNGQGIVYQRPGAVGNADTIRLMESTPRYPQGYVRYYNDYGQTLDPFGNPGDKASTHIPLDYEGSMLRWPR